MFAMTHTNNILELHLLVLTALLQTTNMLPTYESDLRKPLPPSRLHFLKPRKHLLQEPKSKESLKKI